MGTQAFIFLCGLLIAGRPVDGPAPGDGSQWIVTKSSSLRIAGKTNVNQFSCGVAQYTEPDTLTFLRDGCRRETCDIPLRGMLKIPVGQFDCHNRLMTSEMKKTLKADRFPDLTIRFINLERMPLFGHDCDEVKGWVEIGVAGVCKRFEISYVARRVDDAAVELTGSRAVGFSDFGLEPPKKMGGLIKVNNQLEVEFILCLQRN